MNRNYDQRRLDAMSPRKLVDLRWCASAVIWPDDNISISVFRERLQFFALNAREDELKALVDMVQL